MKNAMKLALEALEPFKRMFREVEARHEGGITEANIYCQISVSDLRKCLYAFCDLEEALAKQEQKRPQNCGTSYCSCIECVMDEQEQGEVKNEKK
jgi:hypothetical protein